MKHINEGKYLSAAERKRLFQQLHQQVEVPTIPVSKPRNNNVPITITNNGETIDDEHNSIELTDALTNDKFSTLLETAGNIRNEIIGMYEGWLYEEWDEYQVNKFENLLEQYNSTLDEIKEILPNVKWESEEKRVEFMKGYFALIEEDNRSFNLVKIRHDAYLTYRTNRKSLVTQLNNVIGLVKTKKGKNLAEVFDYFNNKCAKIPLYAYDNEKHVVGETLNDWLTNHSTEALNEINESPSIEADYGKEEIFPIYRKYVYCRKMVFAIFNMITSSSKLNGYDKWHNIVDGYCEAELIDKQMQKLYYAANSEDDFIPTDDYQQTMDDYSWRWQGVYENWFTDEMQNYYSQHKGNKQNIKKIDLVDTRENQCKIATDGKNVYTTTKFYPGDIIEICPTKAIDKSALYSHDIRSIVFEVVPNEQWVIPFGYCQYYNIDKDITKTNCNFLWDPIKQVIVIRATVKMPKYTRLVLSNVNKIDY